MYNSILLAIDPNHNGWLIQMQHTLCFTTPSNLAVSAPLVNRKSGYAAVLFAVSLIFSTVASADGDPDELFEADGTAVLDSSGTAVESVSLGAAVEETAPLTAANALQRWQDK